MFASLSPGRRTKSEWRGDDLEWRRTTPTSTVAADDGDAAAAEPAPARRAGAWDALMTEATGEYYFWGDAVLAKA